VFDGELIKLFVALRARRLHGGSLAGIQHAELQARFVGVARHLPAQRIDLAHDLPFGQSANGRIARHLSDTVEIHREQQC